MKEFALIFGKEAAPKLRSGSYADGAVGLEDWGRFCSVNPTFPVRNPFAEPIRTANSLFPYRIDSLFCTGGAFDGLRYRNRPSAVREWDSERSGFNGRRWTARSGLLENYFNVYLKII